MGEANMLCKIGDFVDIKDFEAVINSNWSDDIIKNDRLFANYVITPELAELFEQILESFTRTRSEFSENRGDFLETDIGKSFFIAATYGSGKSYFLFMLANILRALANEIKYNALCNKFKSFQYINDHLSKLNNKKYIVVNINLEGLGGTKTFQDIIVSSLFDAINKELDSQIVYDFQFTKVIETIQNAPDAVLDLINNELNKTTYNSIELLKERLKYHDNDALNIFKKAYKDAIGNEVHIENEDIATEVSSALNVIEANGFDGIVFLVDEFSQFLSECIDAKLWDLNRGQLQLFANQVCNEDKDVWFISSMHERIEDLNIDEKDKMTINKVLGRFKTLLMPNMQPEMLIKGIFKNDIQGIHQTSKIIRADYDLLMDIDDKFADYYPIQPMSLKYLPLISKTLADANRSTFKFIANVKSNWMSQNIIHNNRVNIVNLYDVVDYFIGNLQRRGYFQVNEAIRATEISIENYSRIQESNLGDECNKILKVLAGVYIAKSIGDNKNLEFKCAYNIETIRKLTFIRNKDKIKAALRLMKDFREGVIQENEKEEYYFSPLMLPSAASIISKYIENADADRVYRNLIGNTKYIKREYIIKASIKDKICIDRKFKNIPMDITTFLDENTYLVFDDPFYDGAVITIIPYFNDNYNEELKQNIVNKAERIAVNNIIVSYPDSFEIDKDVFSRADAINQASKNEELSDSMNKGIGKDLEIVKKKIEAQLTLLFSDLNYTDIGQHLQPNLQGIRDINKDIKDTIVNYYYKFPFFARENLTRNVPNGLIKEIYSKGIEFKFSADSNAMLYGENGYIVRMLDKWGMTELSVDVAQKLYVGKLVEPSAIKNPLVKCIWDILLKGLCAEDVSEMFQYKKEIFEYLDDKIDYNDISGSVRNEIKKSGFVSIFYDISGVYSRLKKAPYGLTDEIIELFIAHAMALGKIKIYDTKDNNQLVLMETLKMITDNKKRYRVQKIISMSYEQRRDISQLWRNIDLQLGKNNEHYRMLPYDGPYTDSEVTNEFKNDIDIYNKTYIAKFNIFVEKLQVAALSNNIKNTILLVSKFSSAADLKEVSDLLENESMESIKKTLDTIEFVVSKFDITILILDRMSEFKDYYDKLLENPKYSRITSYIDRIFNHIEYLKTCELDKQCIKELEALFSELWDEYLFIYKAEHRKVCEIFKTAYETQLNSVELTILKYIENRININNVCSYNHIESGIVEKKDKHKCSNDLSCMNDYTCINSIICKCNFKLGNVDLSKITEDEKTIDALIKNTIKCYIDYLSSIDEHYQKYNDYTFSRWLMQNKNIAVAGIIEDINYCISRNITIEKFIEKLSNIELIKLAEEYKVFLVNEKRKNNVVQNVTETPKIEVKKINYRDLEAKIKNRLASIPTFSIDKSDLLKIIAEEIQDYTNIGIK